MQKRVRNARKIEVLLGIIGVAYFFILAALVVILVRFLVASSIDAFKEDKSSKALPPVYDVSGAEKLIKP